MQTKTKIFSLLLLSLSSFRIHAALANDGNSAALPQGTFFLYAECDIKSCTTFGPMNVCPTLGDKVRVFKFNGGVAFQHTGLVGFNEANATLENRLGNESYGPMKITDGETAMTLERADYRNFTINYSTKQQKLQTGHAEIEVLSDWRAYVALELNNCKTR